MNLDNFHRVVVTGTREQDDADVLEDQLERELVRLKKRHGEYLLIISGEAPGIDTKTRIICKEEGIWFIGVPAVWKRFRKGAGPVRNRFMLDVFKPHGVVACHLNLKFSRGTKDCV